MVIKIKEMSPKEKYVEAAKFIKHPSFKPAFIEKYLGKEARAEYEKEDRKGLKSIPENASYQEKYEIILSYIIWNGFSFDFVRQRMGEDGLNQFMRTDVDLLKKENATPALLLVKMIKAISPGLAFTMTAKHLAYQFTFFSTFTVSELSRSRMIMNTPHCKLLDYPGGEGYCSFACQKAMPLWFAEQFGVNFKPDRKDYSCTITVTPVK